MPAPPKPPPEEPHDPWQSQWTPSEVKFWLFVAFFYPLWVPLMMLLVGEGYTVVNAACSIKAAKIPLIGFVLTALPGMEKATVWQVLAGFTVGGVCLYWHQILAAVADPHAEQDFSDVDALRKIVTVSGAVLILSDLILMIIGVSALGWGKPPLDPPSLLMGIIMVPLTVLGALITLRLKKRINRERGEA